MTDHTMGDIIELKPKSKKSGTDGEGKDKATLSNQSTSETDFIDKLADVIADILEHNFGTGLERIRNLVLGLREKNYSQVVKALIEILPEKHKKEVLTLLLQQFNKHK